MYNAKVLDHFTNPRNLGVLNNPDGVGTIGDPRCGDYLSIFIKVENRCLNEIKFQIQGCPAAIATSSVLTEMAKGKTIVEAVKIRDLDVTRALGGLPRNKRHCSNLGTGALHQAILDFYNRQS